jgi:hypothetical protein
MTVFRKFEVCASYEHFTSWLLRGVVKSAPSPSRKPLPVMHQTVKNIVMKVLIKTFFIVVMLCCHTKLIGQNKGWVKVNTSASLLGQSRFNGPTDCIGVICWGGVPVKFYSHIIVDSLFISNDLKQLKLTLRIINNLAQVDTSDLSYYTLIDSSEYFSTYDIGKTNYRKVGDSIYLFNYILEDNSSYIIDSIMLYKALPLQNKNRCNDNFPFGPCPQGYGPKIGVWSITKNGKSKIIDYPDCYKVTAFKKLKNDAKQFSIILPLQHSYIGSRPLNLELYDYLKTWDSSLCIFLKPLSGKYDSKKKLWLIDYDHNNTITKQAINIYNGGTDTLFLQKCYASTGNVTIEKFPPYIAPASWGGIVLSVQHKIKPSVPQNSSIMVELIKINIKEKMLFYTIPFRIQ